MEGVAGIVDVDQVRTNGSDYNRSRELMSDEANAAATGAFEAGAKEVIITNSHGDGRNLLHDRSDKRVKMILGDFKPLGMMEGIDDGRFDACMFIGYHARIGAQASTLDHTFASALVSDIYVNDQIANEAYINALLAGHHGTSLCLISGDEASCNETKQMLNTDLETVIVKWSRTRYSAKTLHPREAQEQIKTGAKRALQNLSRFKPFKMQSPLMLKNRMINAGMADSAAIMPGATRLDGSLSVIRHKILSKCFAHYRHFSDWRKLAFLKSELGEHLLLNMTLNLGKFLQNRIVFHNQLWGIDRMTV